MDQVEQRRTNLSELIDLAQAMRGWSRRELAQALGRDPSRLIPHSGVPKLDLILTLTRILDWPLTDVVDHVWAAPVPPTPAAASAGVDRSFDDLLSNAKVAYAQGNYASVVERARRAFSVSEDSEQRALACNREAGGWDGQGCYLNVISTSKRGLEQRCSQDVRRMLMTNLASGYCGAQLLAESCSVAGTVLRWFGSNSPISVRDQRNEAFAHFVSGQAHLELVGSSASEATMLAPIAASHLALARQRYEALALAIPEASCKAIANTCWAAELVTAVVLGELAPLDALRALADGLESVVDCAAAASADWLESFGWCCVYGCDIALRSLEPSAEGHQFLAVFTNKADEIATRLGNWSIRERILRVEFGAAGHMAGGRSAALDEEDVRHVLGAMARFPRFRPLGWEVVKAAGLVG